MGLLITTVKKRHRLPLDAQMREILLPAYRL